MNSVLLALTMMATTPPTVDVPSTSPWPGVGLMAGAVGGAAVLGGGTAAASAISLNACQGSGCHTGAGLSLLWPVAAGVGAVVGGIIGFAIGNAAGDGSDVVDIDE